MRAGGRMLWCQFTHITACQPCAINLFGTIVSCPCPMHNKSSVDRVPYNYLARIFVGGFHRFQFVLYSHTRGQPSLVFIFPWETMLAFLSVVRKLTLRAVIAPIPPVGDSTSNYSYLAIRRKKVEILWRWYHLGVEKEQDRSRDGWTVSTETWELSETQKMKSMTELAGGELCLSPRPHN